MGDSVLSLYPERGHAQDNMHGTEYYTFVLGVWGKYSHGMRRSMAVANGTRRVDLALSTLRIKLYHEIGHS